MWGWIKTKIQSWWSKDKEPTVFDVSGNQLVCKHCNHCKHCMKEKEDPDRIGFFSKCFAWISCKRRESSKKIATSDTKKMVVTSIGTTMIEMTKIAMATLLSIFVPQFCPETGTTCTLYENFSNLTQYNTFVIIWNFTTLGLFLRLSYISNRREAYLISHLEESRDHAYNSLAENMYLYPRILRRVETHNLNLYRIVRWVIAFFILNILFSCILIFYFYYDGFRSVTTLLANALLVSQKLYQLRQICIECCSIKPMALSAISQTPVSYNMIDENYRDPEERRLTQIKIRIDRVNKIGKSRAFAPPRTRKLR